MAISKIAEPYDFSPAYNPLKFIYDSTNKNELGFKYIFDVYESGTANKIGEYRVFPVYSSGYGEIDLSKLLSTKVSYDNSITSTTSYNAANSFYKYDVKIGEEYVVNYAYTASLTDNAGNVKITATHGFIVGDQVTIAQADGGVANPQLEGLFTVIAVTGTTDFTIDALWSDITDATINGVASYSDNRKTVTRAIVVESNKYVWNGALSFQDWRSYDEATYLLTANTDKLLTDIPQTGFYATPQQDLIVNIGNNSITTGFIYFGNSNGDVFKKAITNANIITGVSVGPNNAGALTLVSGTATLVKASTTYYDFWYTNAGGTQHSVKYRVNIDTRCKIEDYEILFLDRKGSWGSFAFQLRAYERGSVTRTSFNRDIVGSVASSRWFYSASEFGMTTSNVDFSTTIELNTNWMTEEMAEYFAQLVTSPVTYLKVGANYEAVNVQDTSFEIETQRNKKLIKKTITVKPANNDSING